jgi:hypothetical protein
LLDVRSLGDGLLGVLGYAIRHREAAVEVRATPPSAAKATRTIFDLMIITSFETAERIARLDNSGTIKNCAKRHLLR